MRVTKKGQAALEFLMTYGWAILVVLVAIGALAYFGVLSPDKFLPSKCTLPAGIACTDHKADASAGANGQVTVVLRNGMGFDTTAVGVYVSGCTESTGNALSNGAQSNFVLDCAAGTLTGGSKYSGDVNVSYTNADSGIDHTVQGSLTTRAE